MSIIFEKSCSGSLSDKFIESKSGKVSESCATSSSPDIQSLFSSFNKQFFWSRLNDVEVFWSNRMTSSAGLCYYRRKKKHCYIRLSSPLLKLRPHSDVVNTLLHEMIHAYLFVTSKRSSRDGHGPNFHEHKDRINKEAGTNITVYHSFHSEVKLYKQHWWRCNGPCQFESPYFGMVKRSMNRPPGPYDSWWNRHKFRCSGTFTKIREPIEYTLKKTRNSGVKGQEAEKRFGLENIINFVDLTHLPGASVATTEITKKAPLSSSTIDLTEEPMAKKSKTDSEVCKCPVCNVIVCRLSMAEHLENCDGMQSIFDFDLDLIEDIEGSDDDNSEDVVETKEIGQSCPICSSLIKEDLQSHVTDCLNNSGIVNILDETSDLNNESKYSKENYMSLKKEFKNCPVSDLIILDDHIDKCLNNSIIVEEDLEISNYELPEKSCNMQTRVSKAVLDDTLNCESVRGNCPICNKRFENNLEAHVNDCLNDSMSSGDFDEQLEVKTVLPKQIDFCLKAQVFKGHDSFKNEYVTGSSKSDDSRKICQVSKKNPEKGLEDQNICGLTLSLSSDDSIDLVDNQSSEELLYDQSKVSTTVNLKKSSAIVVDLTDNSRSCPVCAKFIRGNMNTHLDKCLNKSCSVVDFDDSIVLISDSESPVKVVNSNSKFPLPKIINDDDESERRIACRICGMKFGVSKFNGHICYER